MESLMYDFIINFRTAFSNQALKEIIYLYVFYFVRILCHSEQRFLITYLKPYNIHLLNSALYF